MRQGELSFMPLVSTPLGKCGIFEKAYCNPSFATLLYENHLKFRSLGASALSIYSKIGSLIVKLDCFCVINYTIYAQTILHL